LIVFRISFRLDLLLEFFLKIPILILCFDFPRFFHHEEIAYIGDDINDLELMKKVGFSGTPKNSDFTTKKIADYICKNKGGQSAFREFADIIMHSKFPSKKIWY